MYCTKGVVVVVVSQLCLNARSSSSLSFSFSTIHFSYFHTFTIIIHHHHHHSSFIIMVQSINTKAIFTLASVLRRPALMVPHVSVANVSALNFTALQNYVDVVIFDKDNTLTGPYENRVHPDAKLGLQQALEIFGPQRVAILSNSAGTLDDPQYTDAIEIEQALGIAVIRHDEKKPGGLDEVLHHFGISDPAKVCMVGDRLLTDIVFGNLFGMLTVHTLPLCQGKDNAKDNTISAMIRTIENKYMYSTTSTKVPKRQPLSHKYWPGAVDAPLIVFDTTSPPPTTTTTTTNSNHNDESATTEKTS